METKSWYLSKTLWFNALALVVLVAASFGYTGEISPDFAAFAPAIVIIINVILRFVTKEPIGS